MDPFLFSASFFLSYTIQNTWLESTKYSYTIQNTWLESSATHVASVFLYQLTTKMITKG